MKCCRLISEFVSLYVNLFSKIKAGAVQTGASAGENRLVSQTFTFWCTMK